MTGRGMKREKREEEEEEKKEVEEEEDEGDHKQTLRWQCARVTGIASGYTSGLGRRMGIGYLDEHTAAQWDPAATGKVPVSAASLLTLNNP